MKGPETKWEFIKRVFRYWLCRHKNSEVRTVRTGSNFDKLTVSHKFRYCPDCESHIYDKEVEAFNDSLRRTN